MPKHMPAETLRPCSLADGLAREDVHLQKLVASHLFPRTAATDAYSDGVDELRILARVRNTAHGVKEEEEAAQQRRGRPRHGGRDHGPEASSGSRCAVQTRRKRASLDFRPSTSDLVFLGVLPAHGLPYCFVVII